MNRPVAHVLAAVSYLYGPAFMVWVAYIWPDRHDTVFVLVFLAMTVVFFWHGFGWMAHHLRQARAAGRSHTGADPLPREARGD